MSTVIERIPGSSVTGRTNENDAAGNDDGVRPFPWTTTAYYRAFESGAFGDDPHVELIDGEIIEQVSPQIPPHRAGISRCERVLRSIFEPAGHIILLQSPLDGGEHNEPEPDVMVVRGDLPDFDMRHPRPDELALVVEVSVSTLSYDRNRKGAIYAALGIADYWILDVQGHKLEIYRQPERSEETHTGWKYADKKTYQESQTVSPLNALQATIAVKDLLPQRTVV
jgi:Uma2 family endonuclease